MQKFLTIIFSIEFNLKETVLSVIFRLNSPSFKIPSVELHICAHSMKFKHRLAFHFQTSTHSIRLISKIQRTQTSHGALDKSENISRKCGKNGSDVHETCRDAPLAERLVITSRVHVDNKTRSVVHGQVESLRAMPRRRDWRGPINVGIMKVLDPVSHRRLIIARRASHEAHSRSLPIFCPSKMLQREFIPLSTRHFKRGSSSRGLIDAFSSTVENESLCSLSREKNPLNFGWLSSEIKRIFSENILVTLIISKNSLIQIL